MLFLHISNSFLPYHYADKTDNDDNEGNADKTDFPGLETLTVSRSSL